MKKYRLLLCLLLILVIITSLAIMSTNRPYLRMYLSSEVTVDGRPTLSLDLIEVGLKKWDDNGQLIQSSTQETFNLTSDGHDFGHFEGLSYNRYSDVSLLWVTLEWVIHYNDSLVTAHVVIMGVDNVDGTKTLELNGSSWTLGFQWLTHYSRFRPQDDYLYLIQILGLGLIGIILGRFLLATDDIRTNKKVLNKSDKK